MSFKPKQLQRSAVCAFVVILLFSCNHHGNDAGGGNPVNNSYLKSVYTQGGPGMVLIDSFTYDDQKKVASYGQYVTENGNSAYASFNFHFSGSNTLPDSYVFDDNGSQLTHQLTFDGQGRIVKDTCADTHFVINFVYTGNYTVFTYEPDGTMNDATIDSLLVTDGNVTGEKIWQADNGVWEKQGDVVFGHVTGANPGYKEEIANSVGPLLYMLSFNYGGWGDYISKSTLNKVSGFGDGLPPGGFNYTVKTDGQGRVIALIPTGVGVPSGVGQYFNYY